MTLDYVSPVSTMFCSTLGVLLGHHYTVITRLTLRDSISLSVSGTILNVSRCHRWRTDVDNDTLSRTRRRGNEMRSVRPEERKVKCPSVPVFPCL